MTWLLIPLPYPYVSQVRQSQKVFLFPSELLHLRQYIPTYLSTPNLPNLFHPILSYIRNQNHKTILFLNFSSVHTSLHTAPLPISKFYLFITYYPIYAPLPKSVDPYPLCSTTIYYKLPFTTYLFLQYSFSKISILPTLYSTYILYCTDSFS